MKLIAKCTIFGANNSMTKPGEEFEADEVEGKGLIAQGFAEEAEPAPKKLSKKEQDAADKAAKEAEDAAAKAAADKLAADGANGGNPA